MSRRITLAAVTLATALLTPVASRAAFHLAVIDEVMTSYNGDNTAQFVEIRMLNAGQNLVNNTTLAAFNSSGVYIGDVLTVPSDISNGSAGASWIMATASLQTAAGITADFTFTAGLPVGGGMVCWGKPSFLPHSNPANYVDCLAYGTCSGAGCSNVRTGTPTSINADGHSLQRTTAGMSFNNAADFVCADPATPKNNAGTAGSLPATTMCPPPPTPTGTPTVTPTRTPTATPTETGTPTATPIYAPMPATPKWSLNLFSIALLIGGALILWRLRGAMTRPR